MFKRNELVAFGLAVVLLLSLLTFKAFVPTGMSVGVVSDGLIKAAESTHFTNLDVVEDLTVGDDATVTGDLLVSGSLTAEAGGGTVGVWTLNATDAVTVGGTAKIVGATTMTGNVDIKGIVSSDTINILRLNENTVVTGTFGASGLATLGTANVTGAFQGGSTGLFNGAVTAASGAFTGTVTANTLSATDNVTVTNDLTVTGFVGLGGTYMAVSSTVDYTDTQTLIVVRDKTIYPVTAGGPTATLNDTTSISDGFYLGQIIVITNVDGQEHELIIKNSANTVLGGDRTLGGSTAQNHAITLWWDGSDWRDCGFWD